MLQFWNTQSKIRIDVSLKNGGFRLAATSIRNLRLIFKLFFYAFMGNSFNKTLSHIYCFSLNYYYSKMLNQY